jgi:two-component system chemotaxis response regulator CheB
MSEPFFVAIGASGSEGLTDIRTLLSHLPAPFPAIVLVVLHRPRDRVSTLRDVLARSSRLPVDIAENAEALLPGTCYIGEPDAHLTLLARNRAGLVPDAGHARRTLTVDMLFNSVAAMAGRRAIGVVLSGSLDDGSRGLAAIHHAHGLTMALDPGHKPRGMQQNAIDHDGPISFIGTAEEIADVIAQVVAEDP